MNQPKKLHSHVEYSGEIFIPEIEIVLDEFISPHSEHLDSHDLHESLKDLGAEHVGDCVFITEDSGIDEKQFKTTSSSESLEPQEKSFSKSLN